MYYVVSEALTNAAKHANASAVRVDVEAVDGVIWLSVCDDGVGVRIRRAAPAWSASGTGLKPSAGL